VTKKDFSMARKSIIIADPGIDAAFAVALALADPDLDVLALVATAGNINAEQATRNVHVLVEQLDPPRWPRIGAALPINYDRQATDLHGPDGLGGLNFPCAQLHHPHPGDKLIADVIRQYPNEVTVLLLGPPTVLARALDRDAELAHLVGRLIVVGGVWHEPGDASAVAEFHFWCDPASAKQVLHCGAPLTLLPLDVTRKLVLSPGDLRMLPAEESSTGRFLRRLAPHALAPTAGLYGVEGVYLDAVLALVAVAKPAALTTRTIPADVETRGELTRGMSVFDARWATPARPNIELATAVDVTAARQYVQQVLSQCG
jgi:inosine-uridine nucleoside N-ribohydrolase